MNAMYDAKGNEWERKSPPIAEHICTVNQRFIRFNAADRDSEGDQRKKKGSKDRLS